MSRWRILSNFLMSPPESPNGVIAELVNSIDMILASFVDSRYLAGIGREERTKSLSSIVNRAAKIGNALFAQPSMWEFGWDVSAKRRAIGQQITVYPAIWKIGDCNGRRLDKPILKQEEEVYTWKGTSPKPVLTSTERTEDSPPSKNPSSERSNEIHEQETDVTSRFLGRKPLEV